MQETQFQRNHYLPVNGWPQPQVHYSAEKAAKDLARLEKEEAAKKKAKPLNKKLARALFEEYDAIEAQVRHLSALTA